MTVNRGAFSSTAFYSPGDTVELDGVLYTAQEAMSGIEPPAGNWVKAGEVIGTVESIDGDTVDAPLWDKDTIYQGGELVKHQNKLFRAAKGSWGVEPPGSAWVALSESTIPSVPQTLDISRLSEDFKKDIHPELLNATATAPIITATQTAPETITTDPDAKVIVVEKTAGKAGRTGLQGKKGSKGDTGEKGSKGEKGDTGEQGDQGEKGESGLAGKDGIVIGGSNRMYVSSVGTGGSLISASSFKDTKFKSLTGGTGITIAATSTDITITGVAAGHTIQDEGVDLTDRDNLNFVGPTVVVTDDVGNNASVVTVDDDLSNFDNTTSGFVTGPASATDNAITRYDSTTGKLIQDSGATIDDSGNITATNLSGTNTGDQTITLTGDVTGTGTGSFATAIATGVIVDADVNASAAIAVSKSEVANLAGATHTTLQEIINTVHSTGVVTGGGITDDTDATITVAAGTGFIRATDSQQAEIVSIDWPAEAGVNVNLPTNDMSWVYVEYNAGSPRIIATTTERTDTNTNILLGTVYRYTAVLHITETSLVRINDHSLQMIVRLRETEPFARVSGGIISETGTRNLAVTAGTWWESLEKFTTAALDTAVADTFIYFYSDGAGGFTQVPASTQVDNLQYDDGSGTLATLSNNKYGVHWVYIGQDSDFYVLYGTVDGTLTEANDLGIPASIPPHFDEDHAKLLGKVIIEKSASVFTSIQSIFNGEFSLESASDHGTLIGLSDDDHTQYSLISSQAGTPSTTPGRVGEINVDTTNDRFYVSTDTASSADWDIGVTPSSTDTLTNKTINTASNTITINEADIGNLGTAIALVADNLSVFAATTSAQLAGVISDETGSGALVFATSPALVTPALGTPASGVMTNVTGTAAGLTAGTVSTITGLAPDTATTAAAQPNITSLGTLTALQVDNININLNTISSTAGVDLNITPLAGQQLVLDGTVILDAGVITGATSITSTAFVGALTGNADTVTVADAGGDTTTFPLLGTAATGSLAPATDAGLTYNATTNALTTTTFIGALTGNADTVTTNANLTGDVTSVGNATTLANNVVGLAELAGGTDGNLITYDASGDPAHVATGTAGQVLTSNGAGAAPTFQGVGRLIQHVYNIDSAVATGSTTMPLDDTIPQNTEGDEYLTQAITPTNSSNILQIEVNLVYSSSVSNQVMTALFQDSTAGALAAVVDFTSTANGFLTTTFTHYMVAGTTSSTTFKVRMGGNSASTMTVNGFASGRSMGGVMSSSMSIKEIKV